MRSLLPPRGHFPLAAVERSQAGPKQLPPPSQAAAHGWVGGSQGGDPSFLDTHG